MNILVTGAGGMVGSHMVELLYAKGENVVGTYYKPTTDIKELSPEIKMIECDVRYASSVEKIIISYLARDTATFSRRSPPTLFSGPKFIETFPFSSGP